MKSLISLIAFLFSCTTCFAQCVIYQTLPPAATLPTEAHCSAAISYCREPEVIAKNQDDGSSAHWNSNQATPQPLPSYFYSYANLAGGTGNPLGTPADYASVTGNFGGSTDDLARWAACKHGIGENIVRAQMSNETHWNENCGIRHQAADIDCHENGDYNNPAGDPSGLPVTAITPGGIFSGFDAQGTEAGAAITGTNHDDSWGIVQNKVYYQWAWWPMIADYTSFALDARFAEMRMCINGNQYSYFHSQDAAAGSDYQTYVNAATTSPNAAVSGTPKGAPPSTEGGTETNLDYVQWGCFGSHLVGNWYGGPAAETSSEKSYIDNGYTYSSNVSFPTTNGGAANPNDAQGATAPAYTGPSGGGGNPDGSSGGSNGFFLWW